MDQRVYDPLMHAFIATVTFCDRTLYRLTGGRTGRRTFPGGGQMVWLTVTGRKSGEPRMVPLLGVRDGDSPADPWVIAGSNGGQTKAPAWVHNVRANPDGHLEVAGERFPIRAEEVTDEAEHDRLYALLTTKWKAYASYQRRTERLIPVFRLHRSEPGDAA
jgi:deazaflavin-dependent oxidoreductase (nitroreductase family)